MSKCNILKQSLLACLFIFVATLSHASGSGLIRLELPDAAATGKGSAFVGEANRASAIYFNPAGIVQLDQKEASVGITTLQTQEEFQPLSGANSVQARRNTFVFPHVYFSSPLIENKFYMGVGENSNFGAGHEWSADSFSKYSTIQSEVENKNFMLVGAYKATDKLSFAISTDMDNFRLSKNKKIFQDGGINDLNLNIKTGDTSFGYRLASLYRLNERHQFGIMYRSRINHELEGKIYLDNLNNNGTAYATVFGHPSYETKAKAKLVLPQSIVLGYSFKPTSKWTFNFDAEWQDWSSTEFLSFRYPDETDATRLSILNTGNPQNRDWRAVWSESIGTEYAATDDLRLRLGYIHHQTPVGKDTFDTAFADGNSHSITTGFGYNITKNILIDVAYVAVLYEPRKINNAIDNVFGANLDGEYKNFINIGTATLTVKF